MNTWSVPATTRAASTGSSAMTAASGSPMGSPRSGCGRKPTSPSPCSFASSSHVRASRSRSPATRSRQIGVHELAATGLVSVRDGVVRGTVGSGAFQRAFRRLGPVRGPTANRPRRPDRPFHANARRADRASARRGGPRPRHRLRRPGVPRGTPQRARRRDRRESRALRLARLNASSQRRSRTSSGGGATCFEPVRDEHFGLVAANPPFVVSPGARAHLPRRRTSPATNVLARGRHRRGAAPPAKVRSRASSAAGSGARRRASETPRAGSKTPVATRGFAALHERPGHLRDGLEQPSRPEARSCRRGGRSVAGRLPRPRNRVDLDRRDRAAEAERDELGALRRACGRAAG